MVRVRVMVCQLFRFLVFFFLYHGGNTIWIYVRLFLCIGDPLKSCLAWIY
jgi:hypothetical protein